MLGWFLMTPETSIEDIEWLLARSAAFDAGFAFVTNYEAVEKNANSDKIMDLIGEWEKYKDFLNSMLQNFCRLLKKPTIARMPVALPVLSPMSGPG